jgi:hypothetical protein
MWGQGDGASNCGGRDAWRRARSSGARRGRSAYGRGIRFGSFGDADACRARSPSDGTRREDCAEATGVQAQS